MNEILERIAKSLESIDTELKARNKDREILINQAEQIEKTCCEISERLIVVSETSVNLDKYQFAFSVHFFVVRGFDSKDIPSVEYIAFFSDWQQFQILLVNCAVLDILAHYRIENGHVSDFTS